MKFTPLKTAAAALAVTGALATSLLGGVAPATAASAAYPLANCMGLSPNIADLPYNPTRAIVADYAGTTYITTEFSSLWVGVGYQSVARLDLRNLANGRHVVKTSNRRVSPPYVGTHVFTLPTSQIGTGRVKAVLSTVNNNGLWSIPTPTCSGIITVR